MVRKIIFFIFLLSCFIIINSNVCFCASNPTLTLEQCEAIFDFALNTSKMPNETFLNNINSSTPSFFMKYFNENVAPKFYDKTNGECNSSKHFIVYCTKTRLWFLTTNATLSNNLGFLNIVPVNFNNFDEFDINYDFCAGINFKGNDSFSLFDSSIITNSYFRGPLFYNGDTPTGIAQYDENLTTLLTPNLFYLGAKATSDVKFTPFNSDSASWYFLEHFYIKPVIPPDIPSGDTPSGDTPSGDTPNYNDKLDNISGLIGDTNTKLDGISGELGQTNNKLDGISGELGEINDNLTIVPDLTGTTINSGDIESALNFDFAEDPYSNFWLELNTGLSSALTGNNRTITISFRNKNYIISLDNFALQVPEFLKSFLAIISTSLVVWQIVRYIKIIVDKISSGDMDTVLAMNEEERNS